MRLNKHFLMLMSVLFLLPLLFSSAHAVTFYLNSTQATVNDTLWNSTDEYSPYLDYENPYISYVCSDLRECYIDDTNSGSINDGNINENIFDRTSGYSVLLGDWAYKHTYGNQYYLFRLYNDTDSGDYDAVLQRGTTVDVWEDLEIIHDIIEFTADGENTTIDDFYVKYEKGSGNLGRVRLTLGNDEVTIFLLQLQSTMQVPVVVTHRQNGEMGLWSVGDRTSPTVYTMFYKTTNSLTDFSDISRTDLTNSSTEQKVYDYLWDESETWIGFGIEYLIGGSNWGNITVVPKYPLNKDNYHSVSLPYCSEIFVGNVQTDFYKSTDWYRKCSGLVVQPNETVCSCDLDCTSYAYSGGEHNKSVGGSLIASSWVSASAYASIFNRGDGHGYIFPAGADLSDIRNIRIWGELEFTSLNATEKFAIQGIFGIGSSIGSFATPFALVPSAQESAYSEFPVEFHCYTGIHNITDRAYITLTGMTLQWYEDNVIGEFGGGGGTGGGGAGANGGGCTIPCTEGRCAIDCLVVDSLYITDGYYGGYFNPLTTNAYINIQYDFSAVPTGFDCSVDTPYFPYPFPINSTQKELNIYASWENTTEQTITCTDYEDSCLPECPEGYEYDEEDVVCVGLSCYVVPEPTFECGNDICEWDLGEDEDNCPEDCEGEVVPPVIIDEIGTALANLLQLYFDFMEIGLGWDEGMTKGFTWMIASIIAVVIATISGGALVGALVFLGFMLLGTMVIWLPLWVGIVFIVLASLLIAKTVTDWVGRGG